VGTVGGKASLRERPRKPPISSLQKCCGGQGGGKGITSSSRPPISSREESSAGLCLLGATDEGLVHKNFNSALKEQRPEASRTFPMGFPMAAIKS